MSAEEAILALGALILLSCGVGLSFVYSSNHLLKGLQYMGAALATAGVGAGLVLASFYVGSLQPVANACMLLALVLCNLADQLLTRDTVQLAVLSRVLLVAQGLLAVLQWFGLLDTHLALAGTSFLMTFQLYATAALVQRTWKLEQRLPAMFTTGLMRVLMSAALLRASMAPSGLLRNARWGPAIDACTFAVYIAGAIGLAFAFFWRTTTELSADLEKLANTDPLTKVYNRRTFLLRCEEVYTASQQSRDPFSILMLDLDHFKSLNDQWGHHAGDEILCAAVRGIQDATRGSDVICRWGGEEFAVLLPKAATEGARIAAERIRKAIEEIRPSDIRLLPSGAAFHVSVSVGGTIWEGNLDTPATMLRRADLCLYQAKNAGRNCVRISSAVLEPTSLDTILPVETAQLTSLLAR